MQFNDIPRSWLSVVRRAMSVSKSKGYSVVQVNVMVDQSGEPVTWVEPRVLKLEPYGSPEIYMALKELADSGKFWEVVGLLLNVHPPEPVTLKKDETAVD